MKKKTASQMRPQLADNEARDRIRKDLDTTLVVEAAAGTGKTTELVARILAGICSGLVRLSTTVAVTYTEFAAGELKLRLRTEIEKARQDPNCLASAKEHLLRSLSELEEARVGTIHSFCADLLRERPVEANIDPLFEVAPDDLAQPLFNLAFDRWFEGQLANPGEGVRRILRRPPRKEFSGGIASLSRRPSDEGPRRELRRAAWALAGERDFTASWRQPQGFDRNAQIDALITEMKDLGEWADVGAPDQYLTNSIRYVQHYVAELTRTEDLTGRDYDGIEARLFGFLPGWKSKNHVAYFAKDTFPKKEIIARRDALKESVERFVEQAGADLAPRLREELWPIVTAYEQLKERAGYLDFFDLLLRTRNLVRDNQDIRVELQQRFTHIFVDEFQDTDPLQAEILMLLAADDPAEDDWRKTKPTPGKLFIVGDPKQSIYRFRRADVALYEEVKRQIVANGGAEVQLNVSFRSVPELQEAVNAAFSPVMGHQSSTQANYVPLAPFRVGVESQPAIVALPVPAPFSDYGKVVIWKIDESLPEAVGAFVDWLVNVSGWTVTERERPDVRVPIQPRHICLLFRRFRHFFTDVTRPYVRALEDRNVPHLLVGGSSFHAREEIEAMRNALMAIEWPDDELAVFATLHGPLFAFTDSQLFAFRSRCSALHPFRKVPDDLPAELVEVVEALGILRELHRRRNRRPVAETIGTLLARTRAHAGFANWPTGEQALANLMRLTDMARRAEQNGLISFRAFVDWLEDQAENGEAGDAPIMEEGVDGVRMMTVHKAKGLEFPVVLLADISAKDSREPSRWADQASKLCVMKLAGCEPIELQEHAAEEMQIDKEEAARTLYVAATRARDLLVVCAVGDGPYEGWLGTLSPVIYPAEESSFSPETTEPPGCPKFGTDNAVVRPRKALRPLGSVSPGLHRPQAGEHRVVWWDPSLFELNKEGAAASRLTEFLKEDEKKIRSTDGIRLHEKWQERRANVREVAGKPEWKVVTATAHAAAMIQAEGVPRLESAIPSSPSEVTVESIKIDFTRPHGKRFGTLVHAVLSAVSLDSNRAGIEGVARVQGRIFGATDEEVEAATETVARALRHPLMKRAAAAAKNLTCRREVPIAVQLEDCVIVEGVVDLAFQEEAMGGPWIVIDYKTDFEVKGRLEEYQKQVALYALAIARATGLETRPVLFRL